MAEVTILGLGNLLWADEGFGVRAAESCLNSMPITRKLTLLMAVRRAGAAALAATDRKLLIMDAIDFGMAPGSLAMFRDEQVPAYLTAKNSVYIRPVFLKCWHCCN